MANMALMVASSDEQFRETVRDNLLNIPNAKIVAEYREVAANLRSRVKYQVEKLTELEVAALQIHIQGVKRTA